MTEDQAIEIIAALGADPARWPDADRSAVLALAGSPPVAAALADARALDALLDAWASADVAATPFDAARLVPAGVQPAPRRRRWIGAGALAAAAAAAVVLMPMGNSPAPVPQGTEIAADLPVPSATASPEPADAAFAYIFTPTVDEDALI